MEGARALNGINFPVSILYLVHTPMQRWNCVSGQARKQKRRAENIYFWLQLRMNSTLTWYRILSRYVLWSLLISIGMWIWIGSQQYSAIWPRSRRTQPGIKMQWRDRENRICTIACKGADECTFARNKIMDTISLVCTLHFEDTIFPFLISKHTRNEGEFTSKISSIAFKWFCVWTLAKS